MDTNKMKPMLDETDKVLNNSEFHFTKMNEEKLKYDKQMHERETQLFEHVIRTSKWMFWFAGVVVLLIVIVVGFYGASPWLSVLGTMSMAVPTLLLGYLLHHVYKHKDKKELSEETLLDFVKKNPLNDIINKIADAVAGILKK